MEMRLHLVVLNSRSFILKFKNHEMEQKNQVASTTVFWKTNAIEAAILNALVWYFVTKIVLTYCEKKLF